MDSFDDQHRVFAWAGWRLDVPESLRLFRIQGRYRRGDLGMGDADQPRFELGWRWPRSRRFDPHRMLRHQLTRTLPRHQRRAADQHIRALDSEHFDPLLHYVDTEHRLDRCIGFARGTGRVAEMLIHHVEDDRPDEALLAQVAATLRDQRLDQPQRWAFFDHRLTIPVGFLYDSAQLNLGDMGLRFRHRERRAVSMTVRLIYTATLALQRCDLPAWLASLHCDDKITGDNLYRMPGDKEAARADTIQTTRGPALMCDSRLRWNVRAVRWKIPARQRHWLIHDGEHDRLVYVRLGDVEPNLEPTCQAILDGLDWRDEDEPM